MSFQERINQLSFWLARTHHIPKPPPLGFKQTRTAERELTQNNLSIEEYLKAAAQLWIQTLKREKIYPKPYLLISKTVIAAALLTRKETLKAEETTHAAIEKTLNDWVYRYQQIHPNSSVAETIAWLEWEGIHRQFPPNEYSNWKKKQQSI